MRTKLTLFLACFLTTTLLAQVPVPQRTKALYNKRTASWCGPCGDWGADVNNDIESGIGDKAVIFKLTASSSGTLYNSVCADLNDGYDAKGEYSWPNFYVNGVNETAFAPSGGIYPTTTTSNCVNAVNTFYSATTATANAGFAVTKTADSVMVDVTTEFFTSMSGDFYTAVYLIEDNVTYNQNVSGSGYVSTNGMHIMRASMAGSMVFGESVGSGSVAAGTKVNGSYSIAINPAWKSADLHVITCMWKAEAGGLYSLVNANDVESTVTAITDPIADNSVKVYPNPTTGVLNVATSGNASSISVFNVLGERVASADASADLTMLDISGVESGIYFVEVMDANNNKIIKKIVKQ